jgi:hypothetical protein
MYKQYNPVIEVGREIFPTPPPPVLRDGQVSALLDTVPALWLLGPCAAQPPSTSEPDTRSREAVLMRTSRQALEGMARRLAGLELDAVLTSERVPEDKRPSPLINVGYVGSTVALCRPSYARFTEKIQRAAADGDFQPLRDVPFLSGHVAALMNTALGVRFDHREAAVRDLREVASTMLGGLRWDITTSWDNATNVQHTYRYGSNAAAMWAEQVLRQPAALDAVCRAYAPKAVAA